jgi:hypothetical protein
MAKSRRPKPSLQMSATEQFELFVVRVQELIDSSLMRNQPYEGCEIRWDAQSGVTEVLHNTVDNDFLKAYLTTL